MKKFLGAFFLMLGLMSFVSLAHAQDIFTYNLAYGMQGDTEVGALQSLLISHGYLSIAAPTNNFGGLTLAAVKQYQSANGINPTGFVGPLTRASLNGLMSGAGNSVTLFPDGCASATQAFSTTTGKPCASITATPVLHVAPVQISNITATSASLTSSYSLFGNSYNTVWFEYALSPDGFTTNSQVKSSQIILYGSSNSFTVTMSNLIPGTTYYIRAVAQGQGQDTEDSAVTSFTTPSGDGSNTAAYTQQTSYQNTTTVTAGAPLVGTSPATSITSNSVLLPGIFDGQGSATSVGFQYWTGASAVSSTPAISMGTGAGSTSITLSGLLPSATYSYRIVATNAVGTSYGSTLTFTTLTPENTNTNTGYYYYGSGGGSNTVNNTCSGQIPTVSASLDSSSPSGGITTGTAGTAVIAVKVSTDCDASLKSLTFNTNPTTALASFSGFGLSENGTAVSGTFSNGIFTLSTPVLISGGTSDVFTFTVTPPASTTGSVTFGLSNITATSASNVTNQYPQSVSGNPLNYVAQVTSNGSQLGNGVVH